MGCWNGTDVITNLHILSGQEVAVFALLKNNKEKSFCHSNALYDICPIFMNGNYNDYGGIENSHGIGVNIIIEAIRSRLYKFGQGPNSCHDCEVNKDNFNEEKMWEAHHEGRLGIEEFNSYDSDKYDLWELEEFKGGKNLYGHKTFTDSHQFELDRLAAKIKKEDGFRQISLVMVRKDILDSILNNRTIEIYKGSGKGNTGYENSYQLLKFQDILDSIPLYIEKKRKQAEDPKYDAFFDSIMHRSSRESDIECESILYWLDNGQSHEYGLISVPEYISTYIEDKDWNSLKEFMENIMTTYWINGFMNETRKIWEPGSGAGSQNNEATPYILLADTIRNVLEKERKEYFDYDEEDLEDE